MLERAGASGVTVMELPIGQHSRLAGGGQVDACYTLEPTAPSAA
jgi:NitT/TauT family transport system substrate-binding protein